MRRIIWAGLCNIKYETYVLASLLDQFQRRERTMNWILAIASSGSIAAWALWKEVPFTFIWGAVIAASQVLTAVKPHFAYSKYVKEINPKFLRLDTLNMEMQMLWDKLQNKKITLDTAGESYSEIRKQLAQILNFADDTILNPGKKITDKANQQMELFLRTNYDTKPKY